MPKKGHDEINPDGFLENVRNQLDSWSHQQYVTLREMLWLVMGIESDSLTKSMWSSGVS